MKRKTLAVVVSFAIAGVVVIRATIAGEVASTAKLHVQNTRHVSVA